MLPLNQKIIKAQHLAAATFANKIVLFGGGSNAPICSTFLNEEGKFLNDQCRSLSIPGSMGRGTYIVNTGKAYAVGLSFLNLKYQWSVRVLEGKKLKVLL